MSDDCRPYDELIVHSPPRTNWLRRDTVPASLTDRLRDIEGWIVNAKERAIAFDADLWSIRSNVARVIGRPFAAFVAGVFLYHGLRALAPAFKAAYAAIRTAYLGG